MYKNSKISFFYDRLKALELNTTFGSTNSMLSADFASSTNPISKASAAQYSSTTPILSSNDLTSTIFSKSVGHSSELSTWIRMSMGASTVLVFGIILYLYYRVLCCVLRIISTSNINEIELDGNVFCRINPLEIREVQNSLSSDRTKMTSNSIEDLVRINLNNSIYAFGINDFNSRNSFESNTILNKISSQDSSDEDSPQTGFSQDDIFLDEISAIEFAYSYFVALFGATLFQILKNQSLNTKLCHEEYRVLE